MRKASLFVYHLFLVLLASLFFFLSHPNAVFTFGLPALAYVALLPLFYLLYKARWYSVPFWAFAYAFFSYSFFTYWLGGFTPIGLGVVVFFYTVFLSVTFLLMKLSQYLFQKYAFILMWMLWLAFEYFKTLFFTGFPYGIIGYTQWQNTSLIQIASIGGVWIVSALVVFPAAVLADFLAHAKKHSKASKKIPSFALLIWLICMISAVYYGLLKPVPVAQSSMEIALIQPNTDPWVGGIRAYERNFERLTRLSTAALQASPRPQLVVWPETAFVPRIDWHYRYREDIETFRLVQKLLFFIDRQDCPFLIGNDDAVKDRNEDGLIDRIDYNASLLFIPRQNTHPPMPQRYRKMHLVPFTEHFPYKRYFPQVYQFLKDSDTHFWEKGTEPTIFTVNGVNFATPICFEDGFGYISRLFALNGAQVLVNLSNDAWAKSLPCQYQHLSMAVFRSVETGLPSVRATASGQTVAIDAQGKIFAEIPAFTEGFLTVSVPIAAPRQTVYVTYGDLLGAFFLLGSLCIIGLKIILTLIKKIVKS